MDVKIGWEKANIDSAKRFAKRVETYEPTSIEICDDVIVNPKTGEKYEVVAVKFSMEDRRFKLFQHILRKFYHKELLKCDDDWWFFV